MPDYSKWLTPERLAMEEKAWGDPAQATWPQFVQALYAIPAWRTMRSVIEFGCGTGWVPQTLSTSLDYLGLDANAECVERAQARNPKRTFVCGDVRRFVPPKAYDVSCAFSFLKHFGLSEWDDVVAKVLRAGRWSVFSMPIGPRSIDDGVEFPHVWVTQNRLLEAVAKAGYSIYDQKTLPGGETMVTVIDAALVERSF